MEKSNWCKWSSLGGRNLKRQQLGETQQGRLYKEFRREGPTMKANIARPIDRTQRAHGSDKKKGSPTKKPKRNKLRKKALPRDKNLKMKTLPRSHTELKTERSFCKQWDLKTSFVWSVNKIIKEVCDLILTISNPSLARKRLPKLESLCGIERAC